jgi:hypothetical protein
VLPGTGCQISPSKACPLGYSTHLNGKSLDLRSLRRHAGVVYRAPSDRRAGFCLTLARKSLDAKDGVRFRPHGSEVLACRSVGLHALESKHPHNAWNQSEMYCKPSALRIFLSLAVSAQSVHLQAQTSLPIHSPGDTTLHGNPRCAYWSRLDDKVKEVWLKAILSPINMGYMYREKPSKDKYLALKSMAPAISFMDNYCERRTHELAMPGAMRYFEELIAQP